MAGLSKIKNNYYARVRIGSKGKSIPLKTSDIKTAAIRRIEIERHEKELKGGVQFVWSWENGKLSVKQRTLGQTIKEYLEARKYDGIRHTTWMTYDRSLNKFLKVTKSIPLIEITTKHVTDFQKELSCNKYSKAYQNICLRAVKTFYIWCQDNDYLEKIPKVKMIPIKDKTPEYINNTDFDSILAVLSPYLQRVMVFYRETGCRLSEPFYSEIDGNWMTVNAENEKTGRSKSLYLADELLYTLKEMQMKTHLPHDDRRPLRLIIRGSHGISYYSQMFQKACKKVGIKGHRFHDLRHTAGIRHYLKTNDIYSVSKLLGHSNISTTMIYTKFDPKKLEADFSDLVELKKTSSIG